jgi:hypothetical protein
MDERPFYRSRKWLGAAACSACWVGPYVLAVVARDASAATLASSWSLLPLVWSVAIGGQGLVDSIKAKNGAPPP